MAMVSARGAAAVMDPTQGSSTWFLLSLSEACSARSLPRLGELVEDVLFQRWRDLPPLELDPELQKLLPY